jgi:hypothetical protein
LVGLVEVEKLKISRDGKEWLLKLVKDEQKVSLVFCDSSGCSEMPQKDEAQAKQILDSTQKLFDRIGFAVEKLIDEQMVQEKQNVSEESHQIEDLARDVPAAFASIEKGLSDVVSALQVLNPRIKQAFEDYKEEELAEPAHHQY